jgi:hypothetical protein
VVTNVVPVRLDRAKMATDQALLYGMGHRGGAGGGIPSDWRKLRHGAYQLCVATQVGGCYGYSEAVPRHGNFLQRLKTILLSFNSAKRPFV